MKLYRVSNRVPEILHYSPKDSEYNLSLAINPNYQNVLCVGKSLVNYAKLIDKCTLRCLVSLGGSFAHSATITDVRFFSETVAATTSRDGTFRVWDLRTPLGPAWTERLSTDSTDAEVNSICSNGDMVVGSCCKSEVFLYDWRKQKKFFTYSEIHFEPVTTIDFLTGRANMLVSASEDGLINILNITDLDNDDQGQSPWVAMNTGNGVRDFTIVDSNIFAFSPVEGISVWDFSGNKIWGNESLRDHPLMAHDGSVGYIIDAHQVPGMANPAILAGSSSGNMALFSINGDDLDLCASFDSPGHHGVVRASLHHGNNFVTAGEDGQIISWTHSDLSANLYQPTRDNQRPVRSSPY